MANEKELTKLYKVRNGYGVIQGNKVVKEGNVTLTDKEHSLQSWKVEEIVQVVIPPIVEEKNNSSETIPDKIEEELLNTDRSIKKSRFNRVMKTSKE